MESRRLDALQDLYNSLSGQTCCSNQFADKVVCHTLTDCLGYMDSATLALSHGYTCFQRFSVFYAIQRATFYDNADLCHLQIVIQCLDGVLDKVSRIKVHLIIGSLIDTFPKILELLLSEVVLLEFSRFWFAAIFRLERRRIKDSIEGGNDSILHVIDLTEVKCTIALRLMIFGSQCAFVINIVLTDKGIVNGTSLSEIELSSCTIWLCVSLSLKECWCNDDRTLCTGFSHFCLELLCKVIIALTGNDREDIGVKDVFTKYVCILTLTILIYAQTHTTTDLLTFLCLVVRVLQGANLEHVRVIPTFLQCRM